MEIAEILEQLQRVTEGFPRAAVEAAAARREEITPELLHILEDTTDRAAELSSDDGYIAHLYAMFLLAQFRETRAYPLVVWFASLPSNFLDLLADDFLTDGLSRVLASVCGGELSGIQSLIENEKTDQWVRGAALQSLVTLVATGQKGRDEIIGYFTQLFRGKLVREWSHVWDALVSCTCDLYPMELIEDIKQAFADGLVDPRFIGLKNVQSDLSLGREHAMARLAGDHHRRLVEDTAAEMEWWACFENERKTPAIDPLERLATAPVKRAQPKVGRNEPCPCGSGKKYKKCCGA